MNQRLVLIDGHSILNRAFYGVPELTNSKGLHTNAVYGFLNIMFKILDEEKPDFLTVAFDVKHPTFRHEMYKEYKGTRKAMPKELHEQVPLLKEVLTSMGIKIMERPGYEADDILGTIAKQSEAQGVEVSLVSGDRDLLQLATDHIKIRIPKTKKGGTEIEDYNTADVLEKYSVLPSQIIDLKGLMGDASDNIPGVPGIGEKTAAKILVGFQTIENAYEHIDEVTPNKARESLREHYELAKLSKILATIKIDCELDFNLEDAKLDNIFNEDSFQTFKELEFKSLLTRFDFSSTIQSKKEELKYQTLDNICKVNEVFDKSKNLCGLQLMIEKTSLLGVSLSFSKEETYYIPVSNEISCEFLQEKLEKLLLENTRIATTNLKAQLEILPANEESNIFDCEIAAYLLNPLKDTYYVDDLARDYCKLTIPSYEELFGKTSIGQVSKEKAEEFVSYASYCAYISLIACEILEKQLEDKNMLELFNEIEMPLVYTLVDMQNRGIRVNRTALKEYGDQIAIRIEELETEIYELVGEKFNINSPKQLGVILFEKMSLPFAKKTKTGYSTSADILEKLKCEHPVVNLILEYRQLTKLKSTYADGLSNYIDPRDERIHGKFNQTITATGRISSTEPNLQNIPIRMKLGREIRKVFIPEEGFVFLDADYSQIELRVLAHMSGDERLIEAYHGEEDIHRLTASQVFHTPIDQVTSTQRSNAKAVNFGIVYGISSFSLGQDLNITRKEAETYIQNYFKTYPKVKEFLDKLVENAKSNGYVTTLFHRIRPIPELSSGNFMQRAFGERVAMNSPIQGTAADIIKIAMIRVNKTLKNLGLKSRLILQIHDELLIETKMEEIDQVRQILEEQMHHAANLLVPLEVDVNQGNSWFEAK